MKQCKCGSYAFNLYKEDIDQGDLCDVHYWKEKALAQPEQEPVGYEHHEKRPLGAPNEIRIHAVLASQYKLQDGTISEDFAWVIDSYRSSKNTIKLVPLYTTPPHSFFEDVADELRVEIAELQDQIRLLEKQLAQRKPWVSLSDDDLYKVITTRMGAFYPEDLAIARAIEAKFKEKNT